MKISIKHLVILLGLFLVSIQLHRQEINEFPKHIHAWAQSDYYALSLGFIENDLDFFHPQTFVQNPQFPDYFNTPKNNSITAADFPVHTYFPAIIMKLWNTQEPWVFRSYTLFFSIVGLFALFLLIKELNGSDVKGFFGICFLLLSPIYLYYRAGFLASIPSFSCIIIAYLFYFKYLKYNRKTFFNWALFFFTVAALTRTPFSIFLIATLCQQLLIWLKTKKINTAILFSYFFSIVLIVGYFFYNGYLRNKYGSIFLSKPLPANSWEEVKDLVSIVCEKWKWHYLTKWHYLLLILGVFLSIIQYLRKREITNIQIQLLIQFGIALFGVLLYSFLMLKQFKAHDYYFIDTFLAPIILLLVFVFSFVKFKNIALNLIAFSIIIFSGYSTWYENIEIQQKRHETGAWNTNLFTIQNYKDGDQVLNALNISKDAKLLVLDSEVPNIPFILLGRSGYTVHSLNKANIENKLNWDYDYIVMQNTNVTTVFFDIYPELRSQLVRIGGNNNFSVFKKELNTKQNLSSLLGLNNRSTVYKNTIKIDKKWSNNNFTTDNIIEFNKNEEFALTLELEDKSTFVNKNRIAKVKVNINHKTEKSNLMLVFALMEENETVFYQTKLLNSGENTFIFTPQPLASSKNKVSLYLYNPNKENFKVKDFEIEVF